MAETRPSTLTREDRRQQFIESGWWVSIPLTTVPARWVYQGENRLDGGYYTAEANAALRAVDDSGFTIRSLEKCVSDIFMPALTIKIPFSDHDNDMPYLTQSEAFNFRPESRKRVSVNRLVDSDKWCVKPNWLLVSQSGTIGRLVLTTKRLTPYIISPNPIRVVPSKEMPIGYLYAWLSTWQGQALIEKSEYGGSVTHLLPHHLASVPVPILPEKIQAEIHAEIIRAYDLRDEANALLDEADELLHEKLGLPRFDESLVPYLPAPTTPRQPASRPEMPHPKAFSIRASEIEERFDASFHVPVARTVVHVLQKGQYTPVRLGNLADRIFLPSRFKRIYVPKEYGLPFLQGSHLPQMRPYDLKYISKKANARHIDECVIVPGYVLITRSGTIGRIGLVSSAQKGWTASEHLLRIVPNREKGHPGYIAAFLMTPYGQHQLTAKIYGGVVDELTEEDTRAVWIPNAPPEIQEEIGERVVKAFELKDEASVVEERAIRKVEELLKIGRAA